MFQQIFDGFVKGEKYCVKIRNGFMEDLIFTNYSYSNTGVWLDDPVNSYGYLLQLNEIKIYKHISDEEFLKKRKEKYDLTCLNIILKRLVNETFEW